MVEQNRKAIRTSITIPPDLKRDMDKLRSGQPVNWSAIAAGAFRRELERLRGTVNKTRARRLREAAAALESLSRELFHLCHKS